MTNPAFIADLERLEDEIDEALLHCPNDDSQSLSNSGAARRI